MAFKQVFANFLNKMPGVNINSQSLSGVNFPASWFIDSLGGGRAVLSGENVSGDTVMELPAFYAAIRNIAEDIAKLPVDIFRITENGKKKNNTNPLFGLLNNQANPYVSSMNFYQTLIHWALNYGNGYGEIVRDGAGRIVEMWPIHPSRVQPFYKEDGRLFYRVSSGQTIPGKNFRFTELSAEDVYHLAGLGGDGIVGYPVWHILSQALGKAIATQNYSASYYGNGTSVSGVLENPKKMDKGGYARMRLDWEKIHSGGADNMHRLAILEQGVEFKPLASNASEAQLIEAQKFNVVDVARILRIPPHKIMSTEKATLNNLESLTREYIEDTLSPWIIRIKNETQRKIIRNPRIFAVHNINLLTLGDSKTKAQIIKTYRNTGVLSINGALDILDLNEIEEDWANERHMQSNITTVEAISERANLKPQNGGQGSGGSLESGESETEANDPEVTETEARFIPTDGEVMNFSFGEFEGHKNLASDNPIYEFEKAKLDHMPAFEYAAKRIINKESMAIKNNLKKYRQDFDGFCKWADRSFSAQKADIVDVFTPCCDVFINTFNGKLEFDNGLLAEFAEDYAQDGIKGAIDLFKLQVKGKETPESLEEDQQKLAKNVINLIGNKAKEAPDDSK